MELHIPSVQLGYHHGVLSVLQSLESLPCPLPFEVQVFIERVRSRSDEIEQDLPAYWEELAGIMAAAAAKEEG